MSVATHEKIGKVFSHAASYIKTKLEDETTGGRSHFVRHAFRCKKRSTPLCSRGRDYSDRVERP